MKQKQDLEKQKLFFFIKFRLHFGICEIFFHNYSYRDEEGRDVHSKRRILEFFNEVLVSVVLLFNYTDVFLSLRSIVSLCSEK